jgi:predicted dehydrogenase
MTQGSIGVAVIGAGMAGRAHAAGYRSATTVFGTDHPDVRLVAISDINAELGGDARRRYGFERLETDWRAIAEAPDIDAVSVVVANSLHREIIETLLAAGKHVLCEKPIAGSVADAEAMVHAAQRSDRVAAVGYTYRRNPAISAIRAELASGRLGDPVHFNGHAWYDYSLDPMAPMSWRYRGGPGSGILADTGSHLIDTAEFLCGPIVEVSGGTLATIITQRPVPIGAVVGHNLAELSDEMAPVENEDIATFTARFANGAIGTFSASRVAHGLPDGLGFEVFGTAGSAAFDLHRGSEFTMSDDSAPAATRGHRTVFVGPEHPYVHNGLAMDSPGVGVGTDDLFVYQARSFLDQIAGIKELPPCATFQEATRGLRVIEAVVASATDHGTTKEI